jgi:hypothetical protein
MHAFALWFAAALQAWGWVQEMYGFTIAAWLGGIRHVDLYLHMMAQPPWDTEMQVRHLSCAFTCAGSAS